MKTGKKSLWERLHQYHFDHLVEPHLMDSIRAAFGGENASTKAFAGKLVRKLGWTMKLALQAIEEYKRFVYLGIVSDHGVTPSANIDKVWHEHQLFNRAYREFCRDILGKNFDHSPELLPHEGETGVYNAQYLATLELYEREFGHSAPENIWGKPKFDPSKLTDTVYSPRKKRRDEEDGGIAVLDDTPLFQLFQQPYDFGIGSNTHDSFVGEGGRSGGAGAGGGWDTPCDTSSHSDTGCNDAGGSGSGDSGGGGGCSGGSGCSSGGCGGGD
jgi:hypothetical protein